MVDEITGSDKVIKPGRVQRLLASYREKIQRGEVEPPKRDANGNIIPSETPRRFTIKDIGLHSEPHIA